MTDRLPFKWIENLDFYKYLKKKQKYVNMFHITNSTIKHYLFKKHTIFFIFNIYSKINLKGVNLTHRFFHPTHEKEE